MALTIKPSVLSIALLTPLCFEFGRHCQCNTNVILYNPSDDQ